MMYSNKLAVAVKANGKVLREFGDTVYVPFGTEYTILIKNLNSVRAQVTIHIDGTNATEDTALVIWPNQELELQRFIKNGNLSEGNRFKFIERTAKIENGPRGAKIDDGLIRIEYQFEYVPTVLLNTPGVVKKSFWEPPNWNNIWYNSTLLNGGVTNTTLDDNSIAYASAQSEPQSYYGATASATTLSVSSASPQLMNVATNATSPLRSRSAVASKAASATVAKPTSVPLENETGITVAGSVSTQKFQTTSAFVLESVTHSMVIHLLGETESGKAVVEPVTVKAKPRCETCGHQNKAKAKFCSECGTALEIV